MSQARRPPMPFEQFLEWERRQERKHEFVDGAVIAMAGASEAHNIIQVNLLTATSRLDGVVELPANGFSITMTEIYGGLDDLDPIQDEANE